MIKGDILGNRILDLGCGDGMLLNRIFQQNSRIGSKIEHFEPHMSITPNYIRVDVENYIAKENKDLSFVSYSEAHILPFDNRIMDTTILWTVLHHATDPEFLLKEAIRVTNKRIIIVEGYIEDQETYILNYFLDWFFNRPGKGINVNLPLNYKTVQQWKKIFENLDCKLVRIDHVGIDEK